MMLAVKIASGILTYIAGRAPVSVLARTRVGCHTLAVFALVRAHRHALGPVLVGRVPRAALLHRPVLRQRLSLEHLTELDLVFGTSRRNVQTPSVLLHLVRLILWHAYCCCVAKIKRMSKSVRKIKKSFIINEYLTPSWITSSTSICAIGLNF